NMLKNLVDMFLFIMSKWKHRLKVYLSPETSPVSKVQKSPEHKVHSPACLLSDKLRRTRQTSTLKLEKLKEMRKQHVKRKVFSSILVLMKTGQNSKRG